MVCSGREQDKWYHDENYDIPTVVFSGETQTLNKRDRFKERVVKVYDCANRSYEMNVYQSCTTETGAGRGDAPLINISFCSLNRVYMKHKQMQKSWFSHNTEVMYILDSFSLFYLSLITIRACLF